MPIATSTGSGQDGVPWSSAAQQPPGYSFPVRIAIARCSVDYTGRLLARLILIKSAGSVLIHSDTGTKALNWMPAGSRVTSASVQEFGYGGAPANCLGSGVVRQMTGCASYTSAAIPARAILYVGPGRCRV